MIINQLKSEQIADILLSINAIKLQPSKFFTWSSGKKSPIYCDNRLLLSHVKERKIIIKFFCEIIRKKFSSIDYIAGVATGAIPHGMLIADQLDLPFIYVRGQVKSHGRQNQIEGDLKPKSRVIVIEDLISTGQSSLKAIQAIEKNKSKVLSLMSIFTYNFFDPQSLSIPCFSLCNYATLISVAIQKKLITKTESNMLYDWQKQNELS